MTEQDDDLVTVEVPEGTVVQLDGLPFWVVGTATLKSHRANFEQVMKEPSP